MSRPSGLRARVREPTLAVSLLAAFALALRVVDLGTRVAHWDEGRVAYWVLRYLETGVWSYRPIIHGPFVQHAARLSFELLDRLISPHASPSLSSAGCFRSLRCSFATGSTTRRWSRSRSS